MTSTKMTIKELKIGDVIEHKDGWRRKVLDFSLNKKLVAISSLWRETYSKQDIKKWKESLFGWFTQSELAGYHLVKTKKKWKPTIDKLFWYACPSKISFCDWAYWSGNDFCQHLSENNLLFPYTEEGKQAAIAKARKMLEEGGR